MKNLNKVIVLGSGNSGSGAVFDYLAGREDFRNPLEKEFRLIQDPGGLSDLSAALCFGFNEKRASKAVENFADLCARCGRSNRLYSYGIDCRYGNDYASLIKNYNEKVVRFIQSVTAFSYNETTAFEEILPEFWKLYNKKKNEVYIKLTGKVFDVGDYILPVSYPVFLREAEHFLDSLFEPSSEDDSDKSVVIDQGGSFWKPESSTAYYGKNRKVIVVSRDPRGVFNSFKTKGMAYPGGEVHLFCKWYREMMQHIDYSELESENVMHIRFEKFVKNFGAEKSKLDHFLQIPEQIESAADMDRSAFNAEKYQEKLTKSEISVISSELEEYLYNE